MSDAVTNNGAAHSRAADGRERHGAPRMPSSPRLSRRHGPDTAPVCTDSRDDGVLAAGTSSRAA